MIYPAVTPASFGGTTRTLQDGGSQANYWIFLAGRSGFLGRFSIAVKTTKVTDATCTASLYSRVDGSTPTSSASIGTLYEQLTSESVSLTTSATVLDFDGWQTLLLEGKYYMLSLFCKPTTDSTATLQYLENTGASLTQDFGYKALFSGRYNTGSSPTFISTATSLTTTPSYIVIALSDDGGRDGTFHQEACGYVFYVPISKS